MGQHEYNRRGRQFGIWEDVSRRRVCCLVELAMGRHSLTGNYARSLNYDVKIGGLMLLKDSFYRPLTPAQSVKAFNCEFDFDSPEAIDFDVLVEKLRELKQGYEDLYLI